ncbi:hypothetical protein BJP25_29150 [Actinokineospora bangkokensis]|uniref:Uncharacterized protein n=1 Tax=Actinokineospora bangkokensis TaxID=1193682 RepID=A0A1Q9LF64_9PSEU|nr:hypothetical protein BJP25_29150 [Actinokineospora bangkokensis]
MLVGGLGGPGGVAQAAPAREVDAARVGAPPKGAVKLDLLPDTGQDRPSGQVGVQASYLPFTFSYDFTRSLTSRTFWPVAGRACVSLRGAGSTDPGYFFQVVKVEMWDAYGTDLKKGLTARYALTGGYFGYCWTGLTNGHEHYFRIYKEWNTAARVWGDGWTSPI